MIAPVLPLDPEVVAAMVASGRPPPTGPGPPPSMALLRSMRELPLRVAYDPTPALGLCRDALAIGGARGGPEVPIRIHRRDIAGASPAPALVWFHGGGYVLGTYDMDPPLLDPLVAAIGCVAISVDYRLAPETPYPGPLEDCFAALTFVFDNAAQLGVDPARIAVGGLSAGGRLAAAVALLARDQGLALVHQHLVYPMIDDRQVTLSSRRDLLAVWSRETNAFAWRCYLADRYGEPDITELAAPARALDLTGLAPAYIHVGGADGFLDENVDYAARLIAVGVPAELHVFPAAPHGFDQVAPDATVSRAARALSRAALSRALAA